MKLARTNFWSLAAAIVLFVGAQNSQADTLDAQTPYQLFNYTFDGHDSTPGGSGSIGSNASTLNGVTLPFLYCIDIPDEITVAGLYSSATVSTTGYANYGNKANGNSFADGSGGSVIVGGSTTAADNVAWLVLNEGYGATSATQQEALQAAIWKQIYGSNFSVDSTQSDPNLLTYYNTYIAAVNAANTSGDRNSVLWISPNGGSSPNDSNVVQALVTVAVPEPSTLAIGGLGAIGFLGYGWRRRKSS